MDSWEVEQPDIVKNNTSNNESSISQDGRYTVSDLIGGGFEEKFLDFDLSEIKELLANLQGTDAPDLSHAEDLQRKALRCADLLSEHLGKITKTISYLDAKLTSTKNKTALHFKAPEGARASIELRKMAGEASDEVQDLALKMAKAKGAKSALDKKYDIIIKLHHYYKDITAGYRKTINMQ